MIKNLSERDFYLAVIDGVNHCSPFGKDEARIQVRGWKIIAPDRAVNLALKKEPMFFRINAPGGYTIKTAVWGMEETKHPAESFIFVPIEILAENCPYVLARQWSEVMGALDGMRDTGKFQCPHDAWPARLGNAYERRLHMKEVTHFCPVCGEESQSPLIGAYLQTKMGRKKVKRTERGWAGHFICADRCLFRRNTLLVCGDIGVVVSTVGLWEEPKELSLVGERSRRFQRIGPGRYFETMAFLADPEDTKYHDADVSKQISFESPWHIDEVDADDKANEMHERVCEEIKRRLLRGDISLTF